MSQKYQEWFFFLFVALPLLFLCADGFGEDSVIFDLMPSQTKCFRELVLPRTRVTGEIVVFQGADNMAVDFKIASSTNAILHTQKNVNHDKWTFKTRRAHHEGSSPSEYKFCVTGHSIHSTPSKGGQVRLSIQIGTASRMTSYAEAHHKNLRGKDKILSKLARSSDLKVLQTSIDRMDAVVKEIIEEVDFMRDREQLIATASMSLTKFIVFYSIIACSALFAAALAQAAFVSRVIEKRLHGMRRTAPM